MKTTKLFLAIAVLALLAPGFALAGCSNNGDANGTNCGDTTATGGTSSATGGTSSATGGSVGAITNTLGGATASNGAITNAPVNSPTFNAGQSIAPSQVTKLKVEAPKLAPSVSGPAVQTTAPCIVGVSGSINIVGVGAGFGKGIEDEKCTEREETRINTELLLRTAGPESAIRYMCQNSPKAAKALGDKCPIEKATSLRIDSTGEGKDPYICARTGEGC